MKNIASMNQSGDTTHLSMLEHGAYGLLLDRCYAAEQGIPDGQSYRLAHARTREEKAAVDSVLAEFFTLVDGHWVNDRFSAELKKYKEGEPLRQQKAEKNKERKLRHIERKKVMFDGLRDVGVVPAWDIKMAALEALHKRLCQTKNEPRRFATLHFMQPEPQPQSLTNLLYPDKKIEDTTEVIQPADVNPYHQGSAPQYRTLKDAR